MSIDKAFIQTLISRIDLIDLIDGRVPLRKKSNANYFACCPFHSEKSASFSVSQPKQFYYCFGCGAHGNAIDFLMQYDRLSFPEAIEALAKQAGMEIPHESTTRAKPAVSPDLYDALLTVLKYYQTELRQSERAINYLKQRGISGAAARDFCIGFAPAGWDHLQKHVKDPKTLLEAGMLIKKDEGGYYDRFRDRIMFPIHDRRGRVIGFGGRILDKGEPKYLNSPETPVFQKGHELYGLHQVLTAHRELSRAMIVEGYMDVIALAQHGVDYAVATLGTATTAQHIQRLSRHTSHIIFCFDGDTAGRTAAWRALLVALPIMRDDIQIQFMFLPDGEDPDTLIRKEGKVDFEKRIETALPLSTFFFHMMSASADFSSVDGRARFVNACMEHLRQLPEGLFQKMMLDTLAKKARLDKVELSPSKKSEPVKKMRSPAARAPSMVRLAITLLVQNPALALCVTEPSFLSETPGTALLFELIDTIQQHSLPTTGALLEHWRDHADRKWLEKCIKDEHIIPLNDMKSEFLGAINQLKKAANKQQIELLLAKASQNALSLEEKQRLQTLFCEK